MITFDLRGAIIPFSLLQIIHHFKKMKPTSVIQIITNDAELPATLLKILPDSGYIIDMNNKTNDKNEFRLKLGKRLK